MTPTFKAAGLVRFELPRNDLFPFSELQAWVKKKGIKLINYLSFEYLTPEVISPVSVCHDEAMWTIPQDTPATVTGKHTWFVSPEDATEIKIWLLEHGVEEAPPENGDPLVCPECGDAQIQMLDWVEINSGIVVGVNENPDSWHWWCPSCSEHLKGIEKSEYLARQEEKGDDRQSQDDS